MKLYLMFFGNISVFQCTGISGFQTNEVQSLRTHLKDIGETLALVPLKQAAGGENEAGWAPLVLTSLQLSAQGTSYTLYVG